MRSATSNTFFRRPVCRYVDRYFRWPELSPAAPRDRFRTAPILDNRMDSCRPIRPFSGSDVPMTGSPRPLAPDTAAATGLMRESRNIRDREGARRRCPIRQERTANRDLEIGWSARRNDIRDVHDLDVASRAFASSIHPVHAERVSSGSGDLVGKSLPARDCADERLSLPCLAALIQPMACRSRCPSEGGGDRVRWCRHRNDGKPTTPKRSQNSCN